MDALILADDLTGAADCAGASGREALVALGAAQAGDAAVVAFDLNSRQLSSAASAERVSEVLSRESLPRLVYQKLDSLLRGNWASDLAAIRQALAARRDTTPLAILAPAWPERGRTTVAGRVRVNGELLSTLAIRGDDGALLDGETEALLRATALFFESLPAGCSTEHLAHRIGQALDSGTAVLVADADTRADLDRLAAASLPFSDRVFWAGSGGLMQSLGPLLAPERKTQPRPGVRPILTLVGSASTTARRQIDALVATGVPHFSVSVAELLNASSQSTDFHDQITSRARSGSDLLLTISDAAGIDMSQGSRIAASLTEKVAPLLPLFGGLIVTGGETARRLLDAAGVSGIRLTGEVEPGVPIGITSGAVAIPIITKSGAFGGPQTLAACFAALRRGSTVQPAPSQKELGI